MTKISDIHANSRFTQLYILYRLPISINSNETARKNRLYSITINAKFSVFIWYAFTPGYQSIIMKFCTNDKKFIINNKKLSSFNLKGKNITNKYLLYFYIIDNPDFHSTCATML